LIKARPQRRNHFQTDQEPGPAFRPRYCGKSFRCHFNGYRVRFNIQKPARARLKLQPELVRDGDLDVGKISQQLYENYPRRRLELLRELLRTMRFSECGRIATFGLSLKTAAELGVIPEDNEGLIDHLRAVHGVIVAVFFEELSDGKVRVSMRSKDERVMYARFARNLAAAVTHSLPVRACAERWRKSKKKFWRKLVKPLSAPASPDGVLLVDKAEG
jgi:hypothetical protein